MNLKVVAIVVLAGVYVVSPLDIVPDILPILGWVDDAAVIAFARKKIIAVLSGPTQPPPPPAPAPQAS